MIAVGMRLLLLAIAGLMLPESADVAAPAPNYAQVYTIFIKGEPAGYESVTESVGQSGDLIINSTHDLLISDGLETKRMAFATQMVLAKGSLEPISYLYKYTTDDSGDYCQVTVKDSQVTRILSRGGRVSQVSIPFKPEMVILDFSVYHHYDYLVRKYDTRKGGRQLFLDFLPPIGDAIPVALTLQENASLELGKQKLPVRKFLVEFVGIRTATLIADHKGRLVRLTIPAQDLEVIRKDLLPEK